MKKKLKMLKGRFRENTDFIIASDIESARFRILLVIHFCHFSVTLIRRTGQKNKTVQRMERGNFSLARAIDRPTWYLVKWQKKRLKYLPAMRAIKGKHISKSTQKFLSQHRKSCEH